MTPEEFVASAPWVFARSMPTIPHEYTVRGKTPDADFVAFATHIRENGYRKRFRGRYYTYLDLDGYSYWTMGAPLAETTIINRATL